MPKIKKTITIDYTDNLYLVYFDTDNSIDYLILNYPSKTVAHLIDQHILSAINLSLPDEDQYKDLENRISGIEITFHLEMEIKPECSTTSPSNTTTELSTS